ncbi:MAG: tetratricopeptide repeat protein [Candidatus Aminicenantales bacterium]|jgi:tetratricopeptide (TPR) repeat protein
MKRPARRQAHLFPVAGILFLVSGLLLFAVTGKIKGKVLDADGKPLQDVTVTLTDQTRGRSYAMKTDKTGSYFLMRIDPADYRLKFEKEGYQILEGTVAITSGKENVFDATLMPEVRKPAMPAWEDKNLRAHDLYAQKKFAEALALYREILAVDPNIAFIHFDAGNCYYHLQDFEAALGSFREAVRLKPDFFEAYTNLANASGRLNRFDEAIPIMENAIRSYPSNGPLYSSLGFLYLNSGRGAKAVQCLEKAVAADPKNPSSYNSLGIAYSQTGDYARAVESYERYLGLVSDLQEVERVRGVIEQLKSLIKK